MSNESNPSANAEFDLMEHLSSENFKFTELAFPTLPARMVITIVTRQKFSNFKCRKVLGRSRFAETRRLVQQLHLRHYMHNILYPVSWTPRNIAYQFILRRGEESLRTAAASVVSGNRLGFFMALRAQFEVLAHTYYLSTDEPYAQRFFRSPEDRVKHKGDPELIKNAMTLVQKFERAFPAYDGFYDFCSMFIHPNPSTANHYANIKKGPDGKFQADGNYSFENNWNAHPKGREAALSWYEYFLKVSTHLIRVFDDLDDSVEIDPPQVKAEQGFAGMLMMLTRRTEILNLQSKMYRWSREEYDRRLKEMIAKHASNSKISGYGVKPSDDDSKKDR